VFAGYAAVMTHSYTLLGIVCLVLLLGLAACDRQGPAEKAGEAIDRAARDARDAIKGK
jgi:hypothetical protein